MLNDTGTTFVGNPTFGNETSCSDNTSQPQDCHVGRDFTYNNDTDGHAGFSFTKLDTNGTP